MRAFHEGGQVNIEIADDGAGIDPQRIRAKVIERGILSAEQVARLSDREAVNLVFLPGFSTAQAVTKVSGRGVGMDVVRTHIEGIGGTVELQSRPGQGTTLLIRIPLTLAIVPGLLVNAGGERFVIPQLSLHELIRLEGDAARNAIEFVHATPVFRRRNVLLPVADLCQILNLPEQRNPEELNIVVVQVDGRRFGLIVDAINDTEEIVVKPLWHELKSLNCYAGATIMGDGGIALILDVAGIGVRSGVIVLPVRRRPRPRANQPGARSTPASRCCCCAPEASSVWPCRSERWRGWRPSRQRKWNLQPDGASCSTEIVYFRWSRWSRCWMARRPPDSEVLQAVVYRNGATDIGLVVDEIVDIVEDSG